MIYLIPGITIWWDPRLQLDPSVLKECASYHQAMFRCKRGQAKPILIAVLYRKDRMRNSRIREEMKVTPLLEDIERGKLRWYGHVMRMEKERKQKKYLMWQPPGKRPVGRPRRRWIEGIDRALERRGTSREEVERYNRYDERQEWRRFLQNSPADR